MRRRFDAVVVGAGINGMVAAAELALAGWSVAVIERNQRIGGFIATEERTKPGYRHDTYSSWHTQFVASRAHAALGEDLRRHGLEYSNTDQELCATVSYDGEVTLAYRSLRQTAALVGSPEDGRTYRRCIERMTRDAADLSALTAGDLKSLAAARAALSLLRSNGLAGCERLLRDLVTSGRSWCRREFDGPDVDRLWVPWLLQAGLSPDHASGGVRLPAIAASLHEDGVPVVVGGAARLVEAFEGLLGSLAVETITGVTVERVVLRDGRAAGVVTSGGEVVDAEVAVLASVTPSALYCELLPPEVVGEQLAREARRFRHGRAAMQLHVALRAPLRWDDSRLDTTPVVHLSDGSSSTGIACAQAEAGLLPDRPTVVVGQQHVLDSTRVPPGGGALWIQLPEVPFVPLGDARGELDVSGGWTADLTYACAYRALDCLSRHVHGLRRAVLRVDAISPPSLWDHNVNAVRGDPYGGDPQLDQSFGWRPLPGSGHRTAVRNLWHIGASTRPGAGLSGASGHLVAQRLIGTTCVQPRARDAVSRWTKHHGRSFLR
ncbi:NAD(P)/FAD-dependent oxidoreductase [Geodermatophilus aquaeductus]|uniref:Pyridine nucleotide-disulfide oxidoreductase domain-containing protein 2 n=1 Tax=Geodermatophilus aquaeductus TaxID=1564161 RepID=A0A521DXL0_9ACTN|nr:NAD(P)/FAD-dependent oxidoreductase [Geodermatophilus aquaeductus]SMO76463.1 Phytoene dehydrogenase-related protein [Geodermatophilus aquaeductus]